METGLGRLVRYRAGGRMRRVLWMATAVFALHLSGCDSASRSGAPSAASTVVDSAGVRIVTSVVSEAIPACTVSPEILRIGTIEGEGPTNLSDVRDIVGLSDGRIVTLEQGGGGIKIFSASGDFLRQVALHGEGPGELQRSIWSLDVLPGDTVVATDYRPWRFLWFDGAGEYLKTVRLEPTDVERPDFALPLRSGGYISEDPTRERAGEMRDRIVMLERYNVEGELVDTIGTYWIERHGLLSEELGYAGGPIFGARGYIAPFGDNRILYAPGRHQQIEIRGLDGSMHELIRWEGRDRSVGREDAELWRSNQIRQIEERFEITPQNRPAIDAQYGEDRPVAAQFPGNGRVLVSQQGRIWVERYRRPGDEGPDRWMVFESEGRLSCVASVPTEVTITDIGHGRVMGLVRDDLFVEYVVVHEVGMP